MNHNKKIGEIAEAAFIFEALRNNLQISKPFGDNYSYDFIIDNKFNLYKVQVKSTSKMQKRSRHFAYKILLCQGLNSRKYNANSIDYFAVFIHPENCWYIIPKFEIKSRSITLYPKVDSISKWNKYKNNWSILIDNF